MKGSVKWFNRQKGFGFIAGEDGKEYFVHHTSLEQGTFIRDNDKVSFEPGEGDRGPVAKDVKLLQKGSEIAKETEAATEEPAPEDEADDAAPEEEPAEEEPEEETKEKADKE